MVQFTNAEMTDMHFVYGMAQGNSRAARRIYQERYPHRLVPNRQTFVRIHRRMCESGTFQRLAAIGRSATVRTVEVEEAILHEVERSPDTSTRKIAQQLNISHFTVWKILRENQLYPYHIQRVQALLPADFPQRVVSCTWLLQQQVAFSDISIPYFVYR